MVGWISIGLLIAASLLGNGGVRLGEPAPDTRIAGPDGKVSTLSGFQGQKEVVLLFAEGMQPTPELRARLERLETALLMVNPAADPDGSIRRRYLGDRQGPVAVLVCREGRVRRIQPVGDAAEIAPMMELWRLGKLNYTQICRRCHGDEGGSEMYQSAPSLIGIGNRKTEEQIRPKVFAAQLGPDHFVTRSYSITKRDVDSLVMYISGL